MLHITITTMDGIIRNVHKSNKRRLTVPFVEITSSSLSLSFFFFRLVRLPRDSQYVKTERCCFFVYCIDDKDGAFGVETTYENRCAVEFGVGQRRRGGGGMGMVGKILVVMVALSGVNSGYRFIFFTGCRACAHSVSNGIGINGTYLSLVATFCKKYVEEED